MPRGVLPDGTRDILGLWIENTEGAKFWLKVFNDLRTRGVSDILIAVTDGLKGIGEALGAVFPATTLQTCIVHLIRNSLDYASWKDRKLLAALAEEGRRWGAYCYSARQPSAQGLRRCRGVALRLITWLRILPLTGLKGEAASPDGSASHSAPLAFRHA